MRVVATPKKPVAGLRVKAAASFSFQIPGKMIASQRRIAIPCNLSVAQFIREKCQPRPNVRFLYKTLRKARLRYWPKRRPPAMYSLSSAVEVLPSALLR